MRYLKNVVANNCGLSRKISKILDDNRSLAQVLMGTLLLIAASNLSMPFFPVPMTFQTFAVMLIGFLMTPKNAFFSAFAYLVAGIFAPVFNSHNFGVNYLLHGVTSGYLLALPFAAMIFSRLKTVNLALAIFTTEITIFLPGVCVLAMFLGFENALHAGFVVFIIPEFVKIALLITAVKTKLFAVNRNK